MRKFSMMALLAALVGVASLGQTGAASAQGMGDPSEAMRKNLAVCQAQLMGKYPREHDACIPGYQLPPELRAAGARE